MPNVIAKKLASSAVPTPDPGYIALFVNTSGSPSIKDETGAVTILVGTPASRLLTAGAGMTGGGDLSADRTFDVVANADGSMLINANDLQVGVLATDAQHGVRGGGNIHAAATALTAGFMSAGQFSQAANLWGKVIFNVLDYGVVVGDNGAHTGNTDNTTSLQSAINAAQTAGGGIVVFPPGRICHNSQINVNNNGVWLCGSGCSYTTDVGDYTLSGGTWLVWKGSAGGTQVQAIPSNTGGIAIPLLGFRFSGINLDGRDLRGGSDTGATPAGIGLQVKACFGAHIEDFFFVDHSIAGLDLGALTAGTIGGTDTHGVARCLIERFCIRQLDGTTLPGIGIRCSGTSSANANYNVFLCGQIMYAGNNINKPAIQLNNSDSNTFINIACNRGGSGTSNWGVEVLGSNSSAAEISRANKFINFSPGANGMIAAGTAGGKRPDGTADATYNFTNPSINNFADMNTENGEPVPFRGTNATFYYGISGGSTGNPFGGEPGVIAATKATVAVAATEIQVVGATIPANALAVGSTYRFKGIGLLTNTTTASTTIYRLRIGASSLAGAIVGSISLTMGTTARTNVPFEVEALFTVYAAGATGTAQGGIVLNCDTATGIGAGAAPVTAPVTIDTTSARVIELTGISGAATTVFTFTSATMEMIRQ